MMKFDLTNTKCVPGKKKRTSRRVQRVHQSLAASKAQEYLREPKRLQSEPCKRDLSGWHPEGEQPSRSEFGPQQAS